jgi:hypothetical protein
LGGQKYSFRFDLVVEEYCAFLVNNLAFKNIENVSAFIFRTKNGGLKYRHPGFFNLAVKNVVFALFWQSKSIALIFETKFGGQKYRFRVEKYCAFLFQTKFGGRKCRFRFIFQENIFALDKISLSRCFGG